MWCLLFSTVFTGNKKIWAILIHIKKFGSQTQYSQLYIICQFIFVHYAQLHLQIIFQNNLETINFTLMFLFRLLQHIYSTSKVNPMLKYATCQCLSKSFYKKLLVIVACPKCFLNQTSVYYLFGWQAYPTP